MSSEIEPRPPLPPFDAESAALKARMAENAWNTKDPTKVSLAYTPDSVWRNRAEFLRGRDQIITFLKKKWEHETEYRLIKEVWAYEANRIAVRFVYEWQDNSGQWIRSHGNENWEFDENGLMAQRHASINDVLIDESERKLIWEGQLRPDDFPSLTELNL
ncbi:DUF1348 family protein [Rubritalea sp.]|uniref:nuclear transport factor 2 family protein n=1 Tax=Rubritalea sp. TaxID=2109375 RepID=UPI003EF798B1